MEQNYKDVLTGSHLPASARDEQESELQGAYKDALAEAGNISMGAAATALSNLLNKKVQITTPQVSLVSMSDVSVRYPLPCLVITVQYLKGLEGENVFVMKEGDALAIAGLMMGMETPQGPAGLGEMELSALGEAMNQMMGSAATSMSEFLNCFVNISPPKVDYKDLNEEKVGFSNLSGDSILIQIAFRIVIEGVLDSDLLQFIPLNFGRETAAQLLADLAEGEAEAEAAAAMTDFAAAAETHSLPGTEPPLAEPERKLPVIETDEREKDFPVFDPEQIIAAQPEKTDGLGRGDFERINLIRDIPVEINVILGRTLLPLNKIFSLSPGEIFTLNNHLGEPVELLANNRLVAKGEVVMVDGKFGVRILRVIGSGSGLGGDL